MMARPKPAPITRRRSWPGTLSLCALLASWGVAPGATAATIVWNAGIGSWDLAANWNPAIVPNGGDLAIVNNGGTAEAALDATVQALRVGSGTDGAFVGTVNIGQDLIAGQTVDVGRAFGAGASGTGTLAVQRDLRGLIGVGSAVQPAPVGAPTSAQGTVTVGRDLRTGPLGLFEVGVAFNAGSSATGSVTVAGTVTPGSAQAWSIGRTTGVAAVGSFSAGAIDTTAFDLTTLNVGLASSGSATGTLHLGAGDLRVAGNTTIGLVGTQNGGSAQGTVALGGRLVSTHTASSLLRVGTGGDSGVIDNAGTGQASGSLSAAGLSDWRFVQIGSWEGVRGDGASVTGSADIGSGGIVNTAPGASFLRVGAATLNALNNTITGPGATAQGSLQVSGPISGYEFVDVGVVLRSGDATGTLTLDGGALSTGALRVGEFVPHSGGATATGLQARTDGRLNVIDGSVSASQFTIVGGFTAPSAADSLRGEISLQNAQLDSPILRVGHGGNVVARGGSTITTTQGTGVLGSAGAPAQMTLDASHLIAGNAGAPTAFALSVGSAAVGTLRAQAGSTIEVTGNAAIGAGSIGGDGRLELQASSLAVSGSALVGGSVSAQRGQLNLHDSHAVIGEDLRLGGSVNLGTDFGEAVLEIFGSLLTVGGTLAMDLGAQSWFGIDSLVRSSLDGLGGLLGGYGAINAGSAQLAGGIGVDFADLALTEATESALFDLIHVGGLLTGGFNSVSFLNVPLGYAASWAVVDLGADGSVWRVLLNQQAVPTPGSLALVLLAVALLALMTPAARGAMGRRPAT